MTAPAVSWMNSKTRMVEPDPMEKRLFTTEELAHYLGISPKTVRNWRSSGKIPEDAIVPLAGVRYDKDAIDEWIRSIKSQKPKPVDVGVDLSRSPSGRGEGYGRP